MIQSLGAGRGWSQCVCMCAWEWCSWFLVWILSSSGLFNQKDPECPSINMFLSPEKLMEAERSGVGEKVESVAITVRVCSWLNCSLWFISSSWCCQRTRGWAVSLWQRWNLEECFVSPNLKLPRKQLHLLQSLMKHSVLHSEFLPFSWASLSQRRFQV